MDHTQCLYVIGFIPNLQRWAIEPTAQVKWLTNIEVVEGPWWGHQMEATLGQLVSIDSVPSQGSHPNMGETRPKLGHLGQLAR